MAISEGLQQRINNLTSSMASPMGTIGGGRMEIGDGSPSMGAIGGGRMEMFRDATPSMGTIGGGMGAISDQERQMFMDSMPRQTDETQQAIDALQQELQMTRPPTPNLSSLLSGSEKKES